ncbi:MAG: RNase P modulator RnpM [Planctomycetaceae bacterium]
MPERTCVGCRTAAPKGALVRVVRTPGGTVALDPAGSAPGRGAYVHRRAACVEAALRKGGLARSLRAGLGPEIVGNLRELVEEEQGSA